MIKEKLKKFSAISLAMVMSLSFMVGCSSSKTEDTSSKEKTFTYGSTSFGENPSINPHDQYSGWSTVGYGVGETLFKFTKNMELEPWLAKDYKKIDDYTMKINLRDDVTFSNGEKMTGEKVKKCLEDLVKKNDRAPEDLAIKSIKADENSITITSKNKVTTLLNYLSDPYGSIIDVDGWDNSSNTCIGTGPYIAKKITDKEVKLVANKNYWGEKPKVDNVIMKNFTDGDTMTMALQNGEIDAAECLPYSSKKLFENNKDYKISSTNTSRVYEIAFNFENEQLQDLKVRKAISEAINKKDFTKTLLNGNGTPAVGPFPSNFSFGNDKVNAEEYNLDNAKKLLKEAGYEDKDNDGYVEKDGKTLTIDWLTYPGRVELPLLAESAQASLKKIGIKVKVNSTENSDKYLKDGKFDVYASSIVTAPTGDPQYYITTTLLKDSPYNAGHYQSDKVDKLTEELRNEFDKDKRSDLTVKIEQQVLDDCAYVYVSHLKMSIVMKSNVTGLYSHPSDYYTITSKLDIK